jgi:hypothetical protein
MIEYDKGEFNKKQLNERYWFVSVQENTDSENIDPLINYLLISKKRKKNGF